MIKGVAKEKFSTKRKGEQMFKNQTDKNKKTKEKHISKNHFNEICL